jgi:hypothetical protein
MEKPIFTQPFVFVIIYEKWEEHFIFKRIMNFGSNIARKILWPKMALRSEHRFLMHSEISTSIHFDLADTHERDR